MKYIKLFWNKCKLHQKTLILLNLLFLQQVILSALRNAYANMEMSSDGVATGFILFFLSGIAADYIYQLTRQWKDEQGEWKTERLKKVKKLQRILVKMGVIK